MSVKSGHVDSSMVRDLRGVVDREKAAIGIFITLEEPTSPMRLEASTAGSYHSEVWNRDFPKIQIITIRELLKEHKQPELPPFPLPGFQKAGRVEKKDAEQRALFGS